MRQVHPAGRAVEMVYGVICSPLAHGTACALLQGSMALQSS
jgi:hypothetical protein